MKTLLDIDHLNIFLRSPDGPLHVVRDVTLALDRGEALGIVGESGSGKSMTALALMRLLPRSAKCSAIRLSFDGQDLPALEDGVFSRTIAGPRIGMIFQEPMTSLNPVYTIGRQMTEAAVARGLLSSAAARKKAIDLLDRVGIPDPEGRMNQYAHQMSGGQRQRVMIAMTLMLDPDLLIADEPTTALDVTVQAQILDLLDDLRRERQMGLILISHDLAVVAQRTDRVAVMYGGEIVEQGTARDVLFDPRHDYTRRLLAAVPRLDGAPGRPAPTLPRTDEVIVARDITRVYMTRKGLFEPKREIRALDGVSLSVKRGETLALIGESGSGKSTLARILLGLDQATSGDILMTGRPIHDIPTAERAAFVQPVFQDPYTSLNPRRRLSEIIARPLVLRGERDRVANLEAVREAMERVRLPERLIHTYPSQLSGGQRQRVAIARALVTGPEALICDEPTSALDVSVQAQILDLLDDLRERMNLTLLLVTHDMAVVHQTADRVVVMRGGRIVEEGTAAAVLSRPTSDYTARLLAAAPRFEIA
ncbi:dipeptide ABC transporter ATP-binding protein [Pseudoprimorskyibacter insulae]|uniref:Glutathione import ATP-binding protein GsiA n=1 Tax=Pseudoprimorskyibacter insulae TaxID=1695997 RepID=A0A2R8AZN4_9RHOB|nr:ABC transporter ATP-binding protein [Pseudoprimorskyibacter insulae]SPF81488.1 Glutathione import ATP-binding protein GsiA [Pseudoprimorskyibacter insulae]